MFNLVKTNDFLKSFSIRIFQDIQLLTRNNDSRKHPTLTVFDRQLRIVEFFENWRATYPRKWTSAVFKRTIPLSFN